MTDEVAKRSRRFLIVLFCLALFLLALVMRPFAGAFFAAAVLAAVMHRPQHWLSQKLGNRHSLSAGLLTAMLILVVVIPVGFIGVMVVKEGSRAYSWVIDTPRDEAIDQAVAYLPESLRVEARDALSSFDSEFLDDLRRKSTGASEGEAIAAQLTTVGKAAGRARAVLAAFGDFMMQLAILVLATFFLLAQGDSLVDYVVRLSPLEKEKSRNLLASLRQVSVAVFSSTVVTAALQTIVAAVGFVIASLPGLSLLLTATFLCSFIPAVGAAGVSVAAGVVLLVGGNTGHGIFLIAWGLAAVGMIDNVAKPWLTKDSTELPGSLVFFAMICGIVVFGPMGIVAGPLIAAFFQVVAQMLSEEAASVTKTD